MNLSCKSQFLSWSLLFASLELLCDPLVQLSGCFSLSLRPSALDNKLIRFDIAEFNFILSLNPLFHL